MCKEVVCSECKILGYTPKPRDMPTAEYPCGKGQITFLDGDPKMEEPRTCELFEPRDDQLDDHNYDGSDCGRYDDSVRKVKPKWLESKE